MLLCFIYSAANVAKAGIKLGMGLPKIHEDSCEYPYGVSVQPNILEGWVTVIWSERDGHDNLVIFSQAFKDLDRAMALAARLVRRFANGIQDLTA